MNKKFIVFLLVLFANVWIWRIFDHSFFLGLGLIILSFFLVFNMRVGTLILFSILSIFLLKNTFDTNLLYISPLDNDRVEHRHEYYAQSLGKAYRNRIAIYLNYNVFPYASRYLTNMAYNLDPNLYFFANHPRERIIAVEFEKFSFLFLPIFIVGLTTLFSGTFIFTIFYFVLSLLISGLAFPGYDLGPILIFPFIVTVIYLGISKIIKIWP